MKRIKVVFVFSAVVGLISRGNLRTTVFDMWETLTMPLPVCGGEGGGGQPAIKQPGCRNVRTSL